MTEAIPAMSREERRYGFFWLALLALLLGFWLALILAQRLTLEAQVSSLPADPAALQGIRAAVSWRGGKEPLSLNAVPAPAPIGLRLDFDGPSLPAAEDVVRAVSVRTASGASPTLETAQASGNSVVWRGSLPDSTFTVSPLPGLLRITASRPGQDDYVTDVAAGASLPISFVSRSGRSALVARIPARPRYLFFATRAASDGVVLERLSVSLGSLMLLDTQGPRPLRGFSADITSSQLVSALAAAAAGLAALLARAATLVACFVLLGLPLTLPFRCQLSTTETVALAFILSLSVGLCSTVTLGLVGVPLGQAAAIYVAAAGSLACLCAVRSVIASGMQHSARALRRALWACCPLLCISVASAITLFAPEALYPGMFLGHNYTDTYWYLNVAADLRTIAPADFDPELWKLQRLGDIASVALASFVLPAPLLSCYTSLAAAVTLALPWPVHAIYRRLRLGEDAALSGALVAGCSAAAFALFTQCYLAQFLMTHVVIYGVFGALVLFPMCGAPATRQFRLAAVVLYGAILGAGFDLYPYVQVVPVAFVVTLLARREAPLRTSAGTAAALAAAAIAWSNLSLRTLVQVGGNSQYANDLNGIARYHVFPFFDSADVFSRALGMKDWVMNSRYLDEIATAFSLAGFLPPAGIVSLLSGATTWLAIVLAVAWVVAGARIVRERTMAGVLPISALLIAILSAAFYRSSQIYFYGKILFSLGALISCFPLLAAGRSSWAWKPLAALCLALSLWSSTLDAAPLLVGPAHPLSSKARTHASILTPDMRSLSAAVRSVPEGDSEAEAAAVAIIGRWDSLTGTDRDRVSLWYLRHVFSGYSLIATDLPHPGNGLRGGFTPGVPTEAVVRGVASGQVRYVLVCPGYLLPTQIKALVELRASASWGDLYATRAGS